MKTHMSSKQKLAIAAIIAVAALLSGWTLLQGQDVQAKAEATSSHQDEKKEEHDHDGANDKAANDKQAHAEEGEHHDEEGEIALSQEQINAAGIVLTQAAPASLESGLQLPGEIRFNEDRTAHVVPQVAGVVESVPAKLGQKVKKGQVLAVISSSTVSEQRAELINAQQRLALARSNWQREKQLWEQKISAEQDYQQARLALQEAELAVRNAGQKLQAIGAAGSTSTSASGLNRYEIRAPFDGTVVEKHLGLGEVVREDANAFLISDLSTVWADISVSPKDLQQVRVGGSAVVRATAFEATASGTIAYVGALIGEQTRTARAHVVLSNPQESWRPGLFVSVDVMSQATEVPVAVTADALQTIEGKNVVFVRVADGFKAQPVRTGRSDGKVVEILAGLQAGDKVAGTGSFALKAELGKGAAEHSH